MTTTLTRNIVVCAIRLSTLCLLLILSTHRANAQSRPPVELKAAATHLAVSSDFGTYVFEIRQVHNRAEAKEFSEQARGLFDCVPAYNDRSNQFSFKGRFAFEERDIVEKLADLGYEAIYFKSTKGDE
ncbi:MAG: hypothetical protein ACKOSR_02250 [Flavobacteriales bacterium]